jgi:hypothetical protein
MNDVHHEYVGRAGKTGEKKRGRSRVQAWRPFDEESLLASPSLVGAQQEIEINSIN